MAGTGLVLDDDDALREMLGLEFLAHLRASSLRPDVPVLIVSPHRAAAASGGIA